MFLNGLEDYMIPCLNKKILGIECLGCGMQRATAFLFSGEFTAAFKIYPAIYTLFFLGIFLILSIFIKIKYSETIKAVLMISSILLIILNYTLKHLL